MPKKPTVPRLDRTSADSAHAGGRLAPVVGVGLAAGFGAAVVWPMLMPALVTAATLGVAATVLARRPRARLRWTLAGIAAWQLGACAVAWALAGHAAAGLAFVITVLWLVPLPVVPWLYARTFEDPGP